MPRLRVPASCWIGLTTLVWLGWGTPSGFAAGKLHIIQTGPQAGHYLAWQDKPIMLIGDSVTQGWMECGTNFDQRAYVDALASRGISLLMIWAYKGTNAKRQIADRRLGYDAPELWPWAGSPDNASFDLLQFNPTYFDRLKELVSYAESKRIVVLITIHDGWTKTCFDGHPFNRALGNGPLTKREQYVELSDYANEMPDVFDPKWNRRQQNQFFQERLCAKLIETLRPFSNVIYEMFNEGEWYERRQRREHEQHFLAFFRARCDNLLLSNTDGITGDRPHADAKVDIVTLHPQPWVGHYKDFTNGFFATPPKPYLCSEPVPEFDGEKPSLDEIRHSLWEITLAGAGWVNQNDPSFGWDKRASISAKAAPRDRAYDLAGIAARFFNASGVKFWEMSPQPALASTGLCLAQPGVEYLVYAPKGGRFTVDLSAAVGRKFDVRWLNPRTGDLQSAPVASGEKATVELTPPFTGDAVLHLRKSAD